MLIGDLIRRRARNTPGAVYWAQAGAAWTYGRVERRANRLAHALLAEGLAPGSRVGLYADSGADYAVAHFAAAKAGLVLAHLNPRYPAAELAWTARHAGCRAVLFGPAQQPHVAEARGALPGVRRWVALGPAPGARGEPPAWATALEDWLAGRSQTPPEPGGGRADPGDAFQLLYTSGTTGRPKGALISHRSKVRLGTTHALNLGLRAGDRVLSALPLHHHFGQWLLLVAVPLVGATVAAHARFDPEAVWAALRGEEITHLPAVPAMLGRLLDHAGAAGPVPPHLRQIVYGGAPIEPRRIAGLRRRFPGVRLFQGFGQTETGYCLGLHDAEHDARPDSLGRPDIFSEVRLVDREGRDVAPGEVGELVARTPYVMNGYLDDPAATAEYFRFGEGWGRTGDLVWRDADGFHYLAGRTAELIITGGVNVYPAEVERVLQAHPGVREAAVFGVPDPDRGEAVAAAVIPAPGRDVTPEALLAHCRAHLAAIKCPRRIALREDFPRTPSGKVKKAELAGTLAAD